MSHEKGSFDNLYEDYHPQIKKHLLDLNTNGISKDFLDKIHHFKIEKLQKLTTDMVQDFGSDGTVYTGSAGLALYYLMSIKDNEDNNDNLMNALTYINVDKLKGRRISFLCGDAGPLALAIVISSKLDKKFKDKLPDQKSLVKRLISLITLMNESPDELLYGKAGYLYALLFVNNFTAEANKDLTIPASHIEKVVNSILNFGKRFSTQMKSSSRLLWHWHDKIYLGAAHGVAGILYILLQARSYINAEDMTDFIKPTLDWLIRQQFPSGNFPSSLNSSSGDRLVQWCHGAPGYVALCTLAYQVFEDNTYLHAALRCGDVIWQRGLCSKGYSICHGVSGNAYAFLQLFQITKDVIHLHRACCFMEWCMSERQGTELHRPDRPASLFEGLIGRIHLAEDIPRVLDAKFPAFTL